MPYLTLILVLLGLSACSAMPDRPADRALTQPVKSSEQKPSVAMPPVALQQIIDAYQDVYKGTEDKDMARVALQRQVILAARQASPTEVIAKCEALLRMYPGDAGNAELLYQMAYSYERIKQHDKALQVLTLLVDDYALSPLWREAQFRRAERLFDRREYAAAAAAYRTLIAGEPTQSFHKQALYKLGWAHLKLGSLVPMQEFFYDLLDALPLGEDITMLPELDQALAKDAIKALSIAYADTPASTWITNDLANRTNRPAYLNQLYEVVAEIYWQQQRYQEAADTLLTLVESFPQHVRAPWNMMRAAEGYELAGMLGRAQEMCEALMTRYGYTSEYWGKADQGQKERLAAELQKIELHMARYYHGQGQRSGKAADFKLAARAYQTYLDRFGQSEAAGEVNFLLGEAEYEMGNYAAAITAYNKAAFDFPRHKYSAESAYAALLTWQKRVDLPDEPRAKGFEASMASYISHFQDDARWPAVIQKKVEEQFANADYRGALASARLMQRAMDSMGKKLGPAILSLIAQCEYELGEFGAAEQTARRVAPDQQNPQLAAAIYRQGQQAYQRQQWQEAAGHFTRVPEMAEDYALAQYFAGSAYHQIKDFHRAQPLLKTFLTLMPAHELAHDARTKLVEAAEAEGLWEEAASQLEILAPAAKTEDQHRTLLWRAASAYTKAGRAREAAQVYERMVVWFIKPLDMLMEAHLSLAAWYRSQGEVKRQRAHLEAVAKKMPYAKDDAALRGLVGRAVFALAESDGQACQETVLKAPLETAVKRKKEFLQSAIYYYKQALELDSKQATLVTYQMAKLYQDFAADLIESERPTGLDKEEREMYQLMLEEQAYPFEEKAIALFERNVTEHASNSQDSWVINSQLALKKLRPAQATRQE